MDLAELLKDSDLDGKPEQKGGGCMSNPSDPTCAPMFATLGLALTGTETTHSQTVFRALTPVTAASARQ